MIWRILIAVVAVVFTFLILPPLMHVLGLSLSGDVLMVIKLCVAALAVFYILFGRTVPPFNR